MQNGPKCYYGYLENCHFHSFRNYSCEMDDIRNILLRTIPIKHNTITKKRCHQYVNRSQQSTTNTRRQPNLTLWIDTFNKSFLDNTMKCLTSVGINVAQITNICHFHCLLLSWWCNTVSWGFFFISAGIISTN